MRKYLIINFPYHFGSDKKEEEIDRPDLTLAEVGKSLDITKERTRQIEYKVLKKLRHPSRSRKLRSYLEE